MIRQGSPTDPELAADEGWKLQTIQGAYSTAFQKNRLQRCNLPTQGTGVGRSAPLRQCRWHRRMIKNWSKCVAEGRRATVEAALM